MKVFTMITILSLVLQNNCTEEIFQIGEINSQKIFFKITYMGNSNHKISNGHYVGTVKPIPSKYFAFNKDANLKITIRIENKGKNSSGFRDIQKIFSREEMTNEKFETCIEEQFKNFKMDFDLVDEEGNTFDRAVVGEFLDIIVSRVEADNEGNEKAGSEDFVDGIVVGGISRVLV